MKNITIHRVCAAAAGTVALILGLSVPALAQPVFQEKYSGYSTKAPSPCKLQIS